MVLITRTIAVTIGALISTVPTTGGSFAKRIDLIDRIIVNVERNRAVSDLPKVSNLTIFSAVPGLYWTNGNAGTLQPQRLDSLAP
jgi:hypothetical protein